MANKGKKSPQVASDFDLVTEFLGYRNKEDKTNLPAGYLVDGSKNVLNTTGGRISVREGYTIDGQEDTTLAGVTASYDWLMHNGEERNLRAGNDKLEFRYVASASGQVYKTKSMQNGEVYWIPLVENASSTKYNFAEYWDTTEVKDRLLFVNGTPSISEWSGGVAVLLSASASPATITLSGSPTFAELGFQSASSGSVLINGNTYAYTGGASTTTLTGVTPSPAAEPTSSVIVQKPVETANTAMTDIGLPNNDLIGVLNNQIYVGSFTNRDVYISKVNNYKDYEFTTPTRVAGEGMMLTLDSCPIGFIPQEQDMYITGGLNDWYKTKFTLAADLSGESLNIDRLKTGAQQAAQSQAMIGKMKNSVIFISNEATLDELGRVQQILGTPQQTNMSDPIKNLFDQYDFTDGQVFYYKYFIYVSVPKEGVILMYNIAKGFWEAPQQLPVARFSIIGGEIYGHDYSVPQSYKLFNGYNDDSHAIEAIANFSFQNYGQRAKTKYFNEFYFEGYIDKNTTLTAGIQYETDGCATSTTYDVVGTDSQIVCLPTVNSSLGKESLGKNPLGGDLTQYSPLDLPPKFRVIKTFPRNDFYEVQYSFSSIGVDYRWELLAMGAKVEASFFGSNEIKQ